MMKNILIFSLLFFLACQKQEVQTIRIDGSNGVKPLVQELAEAFMHYETEFEVLVGEGMGTSQRIVALKNDSIDMAMASHGLDVQALESEGFQVIRFAQMPVVFAVHETVTVNDLSDQQICSIYSGKLRNWQEVGGPDLPIKAFTRPFNEVDAEVVLEHLPCFSQISLDSTVQLKEKSGELARALAATPGSIGMTTLTRVNQSEGAFKAIALNGELPVLANIRDKKYLLLRNSFLVAKEEPSGAVKAFLEYVKGRRGIQVILHNDAIPVFED